MNQIELYTKNVYGNELTYPACDKAKALVQLTGKKTLDYIDLKLIKSLGFEIKFVLEPSIDPFNPAKGMAKGALER